MLTSCQPHTTNDVLWLGRTAAYVSDLPRAPAEPGTPVTDNLKNATNSLMEHIAYAVDSANPHRALFSGSSFNYTLALLL